MLPGRERSREIKKNKQIERTPEVNRQMDRIKKRERQPYKQTDRLTDIKTNGRTDSAEIDRQQDRDRKEQTDREQ